MSRRADAGELAECERLAARLAELPRGEPLVYCRGSLARLCGAGRTGLDPRERAWRKVRRAAQEAQAAGRVALLQRRAGEVTEYLAVGLEGR